MKLFRYFRNRRRMKIADIEIMITGHLVCQHNATSREEYEQHQSEVKRLREVVRNLGGPVLDRREGQP